APRSQRVRADESSTSRFGAQARTRTQRSPSARRGIPGFGGKTCPQKKTPPSRGLWRSCGSCASGTAMELLDRVVEAAVARVLILLLRALPQCLAIGFLALHRHLLRLGVWLRSMLRRLGRLRARHLPASLVRRLCLSVRLPRHLVGRFRRALGGL